MDKFNTEALKSFFEKVKDFTTNIINKIKNFIEQKKNPELSEDVENPAEEPIEELLQEEPQPFVPSDKTIIGKGIVFYGNFSGNDEIVINGSIKGDVVSTKAMVISESGAYTGNAIVRDLDSNGLVNGDIDCGNLSSFRESSVTSGNLRTAFLETKMGSAFKGTLQISSIPREIDLEREGKNLTSSKETALPVEILQKQDKEPEEKESSEEEINLNDLLDDKEEASAEPATRKKSIKKSNK